MLLARRIQRDSAAAAHDSKDLPENPVKSIGGAHYDLSCSATRSPPSELLAKTSRGAPRKPFHSSDDESWTLAKYTHQKTIRTNLSSHELPSSTNAAAFLFTPAQVYPIAPSRITTSCLAQRALSSPVLFLHQPSPPPYSKQAYPHKDSIPSSHMNSDTDDDLDVIYTSKSDSFVSTSSSSQSLRNRIFGLPSAPRPRDKQISTTPGTPCAGETETEADEPPTHLPTARIVPTSGPLIPSNTLEQRLTPLLFEFSRLLSIVPAIFGTFYNIYHIYYPPSYDKATNARPPPEPVDYFVSALWAILTGYQCLALATGLLTRWRLYYPPLSTLVRLFALQGICWPATHLTLTIFEHEKRPVVTWAIIGTTTCMSRSVQIWVTSNLWWEKHDPLDAHGHVVHGVPDQDTRRRYWKRWSGGGKWGGRRWDWKEVGIKCVLPAGIVYFVMAWAEQLRREWALSA